MNKYYFQVIRQANSYTITSGDQLQPLFVGQAGRREGNVFFVYNDLNKPSLFCVTASNEKEALKELSNHI